MASSRCAVRWSAMTCGNLEVFPIAFGVQFVRVIKEAGDAAQVDRGADAGAGRGPQEERVELGYRLRCGRNSQLAFSLISLRLASLARFLLT